jgi:anti-sigma factor RsiW
MPLECDHIRNEFSALLDNELNPEDRELVEEHLSDCSECLRELHGYKVVSDAYRYHHPVKAPEDFEERFHAAIAPIGRKRSFTWQRWTLAAAAGFTLIAGIGLWQSQSTLKQSAAPELARSLATDAAPASPPLPERAPEAAMEQSLADADKAMATAAAPAQENLETAVPSLNYGTSAPAEAQPGEGSGGFGGGGGVAMPQAAPAPSAAPAASEPVAPAADPVKLKSRAVDVVATPAPVNTPDSEFRVGLSTPMKKESPSAESAPSSDETLPGIEESATTAAKMATEEAPAPPATRRWHEQNFTLRDGAWHQEGYSSEPLTKISIPSTAWSSLLEKNVDLATLCEREEPVIVKLGDVWYEMVKLPAKPEKTP